MKIFRSIFLAFALIVGLPGASVIAPAQAAQVLLNNTYSKLTAAITAGDTSITVTPGEGVKFAAATGGNTIRATLVKISGFREIAWEIVDVTARSTDTLTITRARESTTAIAFAVGDVIDVRMTAGLTPGAIGAALLAGSSSQAFATSTLASSGLITASGGVNIAGGSFGGGSTIYKQATLGLTLAAITGSVYDFSLYNPAGAAAIVQVPTGTTRAEFVDATDATSATAAAVKTAGGLGVAKKLYVGTDLNVVGTGSAIAIAASTAPTLAGAWVNFGGAFKTAGYWKDAFGVVRAEGAVKSGAGVIFTFPVGYRPSADLYFATTANNAFADIKVGSNGDVTLVTGSNVIVSLNSITFRSN